MRNARQVRQDHCQAAAYPAEPALVALWPSDGGGRVADSQQILEAIYRLFARHDRWPTWSEVDYELDHALGLADPWSEVRSVDRRLLRGAGALEPPDDQKIGLNIAGLAQCPDAAEDARIFVESVRYAAQLAKDSPPSGDLLLTAGDLVRHVMLPAAGRANLLRRQVSLWETAGGLWRSLSWGEEPEGWTIFLDRKGLRPFRGVLDVRGYLSIEERRRGDGQEALGHPGEYTKGAQVESREVASVPSPAGTRPARGEGPVASASGGGVSLRAMTRGDDADSETNRRVFVVHGRNSVASDAMFSFLRALGLDPLEWDQAIALTKKGSPYIGQVLDSAFEHGRAIVVLMTPDDVAYLQADYADGTSDRELEPKGQARPNVLFEAGMAIGRDEDHTILVELGEIRPFSDVGGRHTIRMDNSAQRRQALATRLETAGLPVNRSGVQWLTAGDFTPPKAGGGLPLGKRVPAADKRGPSVDARWSSRGGNKVDRLTIINGPVDLFEVTVEIPTALEGVQLWDNDKPVKKLPAFKTFSINGIARIRALGATGPEQFELDVLAELEDGTPFRQSVYVDASG